MDPQEVAWQKFCEKYGLVSSNLSHESMIYRAFESGYEAGYDQRDLET